MRRISYGLACLALVVALGAPARAFARTDISIQIGDRYRGPDLYWRGTPRMYVIPGSRVYYVRDSDYDVYRYGRYWYYNYDGRWYRSRSYRGPWIYVGYRSVPSQIGYVPMRYRRHWREFRDDARYGSYRRYRDSDRQRRYREDRYRDERYRSRDDRYRDDRDRDRDRDRGY